jgi:hypothetical protein
VNAGAASNPFPLKNPIRLALTRLGLSPIVLKKHTIKIGYPNKAFIQRDLSLQEI